MTKTTPLTTDRKWRKSDSYRERDFIYYKTNESFKCHTVTVLNLKRLDLDQGEYISILKQQYYYS